MISKIMLVGLGGFLGSALRYIVQISMQSKFSNLFPFGTVIANLLGCFIIGVIFGFVEKGNFLNPNMRLLLAVGFCGGFTTFSSFAFEALQLFKQGGVFFFAIYVGVSVCIGILLTYLGMYLVKQL